MWVYITQVFMWKLNYLFTLLFASAIHLCSILVIFTVHCAPPSTPSCTGLLGTLLTKSLRTFLSSFTVCLLRVSNRLGWECNLPKQAMYHYYHKLREHFRSLRDNGCDKHFCQNTWRNNSPFHIQSRIYISSHKQMSPPGPTVILNCLWS